MTSKLRSTPLWILIISGLFALMEVGVSIALVLAPESVASNVDLQGKGVSYLIQMWAARQFALGFIFGYAIFKRSASLLKLTYLFFLVMFIGDFFIGIREQDPSIYGAAVVMCLVSSVMIYFINKNRK